MLHAGINPEDPGADELDRRGARRREFAGEIVIAWDHDPEQRVRLGVTEVSNEGARITSTLPLLRETTGIAIQLLPGAARLNKPFVVRWVSRDEAGQYIAGLEFLA